MSIKQSSGLKRNTIDKFYTKEHVAISCCEIIKDILDINFKDLIIEPSAGGGSFITPIKEMCPNHKFYDIKPENGEIIEQDFLKLDITSFKEEYANLHFIGNPPFGRQSSLAIKFIKHASKHCKSISFILPKSFKKNSLKSKISLDFHLVYEKDLPKNSFTTNNTDCDVPCVFQIWKREDHKRVLPKKLNPYSYKFVKKTSNPDISFRRVGVYAGKIETEIEMQSPQSHYFICFDSFSETILNKLKKIKYDSDNTVGPKSISKQELIKEFNKLLSKE